MEVYQPLLTGHHVTHQTPIKHQRIQSHQFLDRHQKTLSKIKLRLGYLLGIFLLNFKLGAFAQSYNHLL